MSDKVLLGKGKTCLVLVNFQMRSFDGEVKKEKENGFARWGQLHPSRAVFVFSTFNKNGVISNIFSCPCSSLHLKSEPEDDNYYSPKLEKSLKRERVDDNE